VDQLRQIAGSLATASTALNRRQELAAQVFQQGHLRPTRTLSEQAHIEMDDAKRREEVERTAQQARAAHQAALGSDEDEEEVMRQRAKDDWRDVNPKGAGNSKSKPCG